MKKVNAKQRILDTASELFHQRGYKETGINEIIDVSGTAKATFYSHFKTKEALGEAWLESVHEASEKERLLRSEKSKSSRDELIAYFKELKSFLKNGNFRGCPFTNTSAVVSPNEDPLLRKIHEHKTAVRKSFQKIAQEARKDRNSANSLGDAFFLIYSGGTTEAQNLKSLWPVDRSLKTALQLWDSEPSLSPLPEK